MLWVDTETYSEVPVKQGTYVYLENAEVMILAYAFDDEDVNVLDLANGDTLPTRLQDAFADESMLVGMHNSMFDRVALRNTGIADIHPRRIHDTQVQALSHSLPCSLATLCELFNIDVTDAKDSEGKKLIQLFCKPRGKNVKVKRATKITHPDEWAQFISYAASDVRAMRALFKVMPKWNDTIPEHRVWELDQKINDRGLPIDLDLAIKAVEAVSARKAELNETAQGLDENLKSLTQCALFIEYLTLTHHIVLPDLRKATIEAMLADDDTPAEMKPLLLMRLEAAGTGDSKYRTVLKAVNSDGRLRGTKQFCGAARTGRWAGRKFQPDNLLRPIIDKALVDPAIAAIKAGCLDLVTPDTIAAVKSVVRGVIEAPDGYKFVVSDWSNIEGRAQAHLASEGWKIKAFEAFDAGVGPDLYKLAYARSFNVDVRDVDSFKRQIGKVMELALGYAGGAPAFASMAANYSLDLDTMASNAWSTLPDDIRREALTFTTWLLKKQGNDERALGMTRKAFEMCAALKIGWRAAHPRIVELWAQLIEGAVAVVSRRVSHVDIGSLTLRRQGRWFLIQLPSGRCLSYPQAEVIDDKTIGYKGALTVSRKWGDLYATGGKLFENICQAFARDILAYRMPDIEDAGYPIILTVHDEVVAEVPDDPAYNAHDLSAIMCRPFSWAKGMPLAAEGYESYRFRK